MFATNSSEKKYIKTAEADVVKYSISLSLKLYKNRKLNQYQCLSSTPIKSKPLGTARLRTSVETYSTTRQVSEILN